MALTVRTWLKHMSARFPSSTTKSSRSFKPSRCIKCHSRMVSGLSTWHWHRPRPRRESSVADTSSTRPASLPPDCEAALSPANNKPPASSSGSSSARLFAPEALAWVVSPPWAAPPKSRRPTSLATMTTGTCTPRVSPSPGACGRANGTSDEASEAPKGAGRGKKSPRRTSALAALVALAAVAAVAALATWSPAGGVSMITTVEMGADSRSVATTVSPPARSPAAPTCRMLRTFSANEQPPRRTKTMGPCTSPLSSDAFPLLSCKSPPSLPPPPCGLAATWLPARLLPAGGRGPLERPPEGLPELELELLVHPSLGQRWSPPLAVTTGGKSEK
mmetsp:Transcript_53313/g.121523  ORF Transcript_53313/g.121523 Transcript_53313/m.121523 type:complete len:333 (+) Transcript_53313:835-1833(+)